MELHEVHVLEIEALGAVHGEDRDRVRKQLARPILLARLFLGDGMPQTPQHVRNRGSRPQLLRQLAEEALEVGSAPAAEETSGLAHFEERGGAQALHEHVACLARKALAKCGQHRDEVEQILLPACDALEARDVRRQGRRNLHDLVAQGLERRRVGQPCGLRRKVTRDEQRMQRNVGNPNGGTAQRRHQCQPVTGVEYTAHQRGGINDLPAPVVAPVALDLEGHIGLAQRTEVHVPITATPEEHADRLPGDTMLIVQLTQIAGQRAGLELIGF